MANDSNPLESSTGEHEKVESSVLSSPKVAKSKRKGGRADVFFCSTDEHTILFDSRELILKHPKNCVFKGSTLDQRKTFHHWQSFLYSVDRCKLNIQKEVMEKLSRKYGEVRNNATY